MEGSEGGPSVRGPPRRGNSFPAAVWKEKEQLDGKAVDAGVVILSTSGCSHFHAGGCSMCGYNIESRSDIRPDDLKRQFETATAQLPEIAFLKVYTSGSFLDVREIPVEVADVVLDFCRENGLKLLLESRPEFVRPERLDDMLARHDDIEIALGLESSNDRVLRYSINKGFAVADYSRAADIIVDKGIDLRTYVLLKPPFLTEAEAVADARETIGFASKRSTTVSLNPVNVQKGTLVEKLWKTWSYRPPWLWSVLEVLRTSNPNSSRLICEPTGGGKARGAHNCSKCDDAILESLRSYSLSQDKSRLRSPTCSCKDLWEAVMSTEGFVVGGTADLQRFFRMHGA